MNSVVKLCKASFISSLALLACLLSPWAMAEQQARKVTANYQVKASFFALPIKARIAVEQLDEERYQASILLKSPFFKVDQKEQARISACNVELLEVQSKGNRIGASSWDEEIHISWPDKTVSYQDGESQQTYHASYTPTGFVSFFAHQFTAFHKQQKQSSLMYTQSTKGWRTDFIFKGLDKKVDNHYFKNDVDAYRFVTPRKGMEEKDMPNVWYVPEKLGAFPLRMSMKLGVFRIEVNLKEINASEEQVHELFASWQCKRQKG